ncbi:MAG TPA: SDR family oxidoreductase [Chitinophagaceae bacterium]|nr:SDR family oxidoreductase [Chitinophagaceae bacterium]
MSYALITGASKGIGKAMAASLAGRKFNLLLVARSGQLLQDTAEDLILRFGIQVQWLAIDLADPGAVGEILKWIQVNQFPVSVLINNAGYGLWGNFTDRSAEDWNNMLQLNILTLVKLTHGMIPILLLQPKKYILNVGSTAGFQAIPTLSLYAGSKALVNIFTRGLSHELKDLGISVTLLAPGSVKTDFVRRSGMVHMQEFADRMSMEPGIVAEKAIKAMLQGKREIIPGRTNRFSVSMVRLMPRSMIERLAGSLYRVKEKPV